MTSATTSSTRAAQAAERRSCAGCWSWKIVVRIWLMVASRSATVARIRSVARPGAERGGERLQGQAGGEQALDDVVVQVRGDAVALVEHGGPLLLGAGLGELDGDGGLVGEAGGHVQVLGGERRPAAQPRDARAHRGCCGEPTSGTTSIGPTSRSSGTAAEAGPLVGSRHPQRRAGREHPPGQRALPRYPQPDRCARRRARPPPRRAGSPSSSGSTTVTRSAWATSRLCSAISCSGSARRGRRSSSRRAIVGGGLQPLPAVARGLVEPGVVDARRRPWRRGP